jgi:hypothetical protein
MHRVQQPHLLSLEAGNRALQQRKQRPAESPSAERSPLSPRHDLFITAIAITSRQIVSLK